MVLFLIREPLSYFRPYKAYFVTIYAFFNAFPISQLVLIFYPEAYLIRITTQGPRGQRRPESYRKMFRNDRNNATIWICLVKFWIQLTRASESCWRDSSCRCSDCLQETDFSESISRTSPLSGSQSGLDARRPHNSNLWK